ncbi:MAG: phage antirepressor N-terminal domain-containing protein [Muribaculaceae bacterium]|nr:phage antirepressor N-terminal domain-containing protein [Muribaculaceae bacterium]
MLSTSTEADNRLYEMFCLPLFFIPGWLLSVNPKNVAPEARVNGRGFILPLQATLLNCSC